METDHRVVAGDARRLEAVADDSVELVVTSPPYPMIELWDDLFAELDPAVGEALDAADGDAAFEAMHAQLDRVWAEVDRVLVEGGIACVNVGDATRRLGDRFRVYPNHARVLSALEDRGFDPLPEILWRKPVNAAAKFMGSGMLPPNAYVTLEHEYILVLRNGQRRRFEPGEQRRYESAYFWEERNRWFSDVWTDVTGELQAIEGGGEEGVDSDGGSGRPGAGDGGAALRDRSGAYPFEIPHRLIAMYSVYGDTVLDPFLGTGTTTLAAMVAARDSIGVELREPLLEAFDDRVAAAPRAARDVVERRLADHADFVEERRAAGESFDYAAEHYGLPVVTSQEEAIRFYGIEGVTPTDEGYAVRHRPLEGPEAVPGWAGRPEGTATPPDG